MTRVCLLTIMCSILSKTLFFIRNIARLRSMLSLPVTERLINTLVFSHIDYYNALLVGVPKTTLNKLQCVQNSAARILTGARKNEHITPILKSLHWLSVRFRVDFKILMLTYKALHGLAPQYLSALLTLYTPKRLLRSSQAGLLVVPQTRLRSVGDRAFSSYAPRLWNALPLQIREAQNLSIFKSYLKTHFFRLAFSWLFDFKLYLCFNRLSCVCWVFTCLFYYVKRFEKLF